MSSPVRSRSPSPTPSKLPPVPASPTYSYASTANPIPSSFNLPLPPTPRPIHAVLTKADLELSQTAYTDLLASAKAYRLALAALSTSASTFGSALEACARLKEARSEALHAPGGSLSNSFTAKGSCTADGLLAASGVHQLIANHQQILSEVVYRSFEVPLLHELDTWNRKIEEEEVTYQTSAKAMSKEIRRMEKEGIKVYKQRKRDVRHFRDHLVNLTSKLDGLTSLHGGHSRGLLRDCQETSGNIVECSAGLVRAEVDIFEALAKKGWSGGGLDELLEKGRDLLSNDGAPPSKASEGTQIFSILPQKSILPDSKHDGTATSLVGGRFDGNKYQSLAGAVSQDMDAASVLSTSTTGILNRSRGVRPFSPPPMERVKDSGPLGSTEDDESSKTVMQSAAPTVNKSMKSEDEIGHGKAVTQATVSTGEWGAKSLNENDNGEDRIERGRERRWSITDDGGND